MFSYQRTAQYHETDQMGIIHHANYLKWMEEARIAYLQSIGISYAELEKQGIVSPVVDIHIAYRHPAHFADRICIGIQAESYSGVRLVLRYEMTNAEGLVVANAESTHCFQRNGRIVSLKKACPAVSEKLEQGLLDR